jgi:hypothetical protein
MSINSVQSNTALDQLARSLATRFDANNDGKLTTDEFTSFLTQFLGSATNAATTGGTSTASKSTDGFHGTVRPRMSGFSASKLADLSHTTIKYRFARVAQTYSLEGVHDKASAEALLTSMKPDLEAAGIKVLDVQKDSIQVQDGSSAPVWYDVIWGANGSSPAWQWLSKKA